MDELKDFLNALAASPKARDLLKVMKEPADLEEASIQYAGLVEELGYHIGKDDIRKWLEEKEKEQREKSAKAETDVKDRLEEDDLDAVAGGADYEKHNTACYTTYDKDE